MSLSDRLRKMEQRLADLESFRDSVMAELAADDAEAAGQPERTLDGDAVGGERDQSQSLG